MLERLDLKVGFKCNNNCIFCAQAHRRDLGDQTTKKLKKDLEDAYNEGIKEVVFTGGEPTIRPDILKLVTSARNIGYEVIQIQTNGRMLSYKNFCEKLIKSGVTEFAPSIHGHTAKIHDSQTRSPGSYNQIIKGLKNLRELDQYILSNSVITKFNYKYLPELVQLLIDLKVDQLQLAFVHPCGNAWKYFDQIVPRKSLVAPYIHKALDIVKNTQITAMIEAFPFCFMQGYEKYCSEFYIPKAEVRDTEGIIDFDKWKKELGKVKFPQCKKCKFNLICEGPWREYGEKYGSDEFVPIKGEQIHSKNLIVDKVNFNTITRNVKGKNKKNIKIGILKIPFDHFISSRINEKLFFDNMSHFVTLKSIKTNDLTKDLFQKIGKLDIDYLYFNPQHFSIFPFLYRDLLQVNIPFIFITHTIFGWLQFFLFSAPFIRSGDIIIAPSEYSKKCLNMILKVKNIHVIPFSFDVESIQKNIKNINVDNKQKIITYLGRLEKEKGVEILLYAIPIIKEKIPNIKLNILGPLSSGDQGSYFKMLKNLTIKLGIKNNVSFLGPVFGNEKYKLLAKSSVFINPSICSDETFGVVNIESFICGVPVVCPNYPFFREAILDGKNGYLVDFNWINEKQNLDPNQIADKVLRILKDDNLRLKMGKNALKIGKKYDYKKILPNLIDLLHVKKRMKGNAIWEKIKNHKIIDFKEYYNPNLFEIYNPQNLTYSDIEKIEHLHLKGKFTEKSNFYKLSFSQPEIKDKLFYLACNEINPNAKIHKKVLINSN